MSSAIDDVVDDYEDRVEAWVEKHNKPRDAQADNDDTILPSHRNESKTLAGGL